MQQVAGEDDYLSTIRALEIHVDELRNICEKRLEFQRIASSDPFRLRNLFHSISDTLGEAVALAPDQNTAAAARKRQLMFDEVTDPIFEHINGSNYSPEIKAKDRSGLRGEIDILRKWVADNLS